jgi:hypothetical protein
LATPKLELLAFTAVTLAVPAPEFVRVTVREAVVPTRTDPKSADVGAAATLAGAGGGGGVGAAEDAPVLPQPVRRAPKRAIKAVTAMRTDLRIAIKLVVL